MSAATVEAFHLAFLQGFVRAAAPTSYALKGGSNLRFFFGSVRYSEDVDLDAQGTPVSELRDTVMAILRSRGLASTMRLHGVQEVRPPDVRAREDRGLCPPAATYCLELASAQDSR